MTKTTVDNYQELAERTSATSPEMENFKGVKEIEERLQNVIIVRLLHGAMGLCTEAGELQDQLKKHIFYGADLDLVNVSEECGDIFWYLAEVLTAIDRKFIDVMQQNIDKLRARYILSDKFTEEQALNRDLEKERCALSADELPPKKEPPLSADILEFGPPDESDGGT